jgi:hypothetical protein
MPGHRDYICAALAASPVNGECNGNVLRLKSDPALRDLHKIIRPCTKGERSTFCFLIRNSDKPDEIRKYAYLVEDMWPTDTGGRLHFITYFSFAQLHLFVQPGSSVCDFAIYAKIPSRPDNDPNIFNDPIHVRGTINGHTGECEIASRNDRVSVPTESIQLTLEKLLEFSVTDALLRYLVSGWIYHSEIGFGWFSAFAILSIVRRLQLSDADNSASEKQERTADDLQKKLYDNEHIGRIELRNLFDEWLEIASRLQLSAADQGASENQEPSVEDPTIGMCDIKYILRVLPRDLFCECALDVCVKMKGQEDLYASMESNYFCSRETMRGIVCLLVEELLAEKKLLQANKIFSYSSGISFWPPEEITSDEGRISAHEPLAAHVFPNSIIDNKSDTFRRTPNSNYNLLMVSPLFGLSPSLSADLCNGITKRREQANWCDIYFHVVSFFGASMPSGTSYDEISFAALLAAARVRQGSLDGYLNLLCRPSPARDGFEKMRADCTQIGDALSKTLMSIEHCH